MVQTPKIFEDTEANARFNETLQRMLKTPPKLHEKPQPPKVGRQPNLNKQKKRVAKPSSE